jgi:hypothetical protein
MRNVTEMTSKVQHEMSEAFAKKPTPSATDAGKELHKVHTPLGNPFKP